MVGKRKMKYKTPKMSVAEFLKSYPRPIRTLTNELRKLTKEFWSLILEAALFALERNIR